MSGFLMRIVSRLRQWYAAAHTLLKSLGGAAAPRRKQDLLPALTPAWLAKGELLDAQQALNAARAAGLKVELWVPYPVRCPAVAASAGKPNPLAADDLGLVISDEGFLHADVGVAEAAALLGPPVLANQTSARFLKLHLAPRHAQVQQATLELQDGELTGIVLGFAKPVLVDVTELERKYGPAKQLPGHYDPAAPKSDSFIFQNADFKALLIFSSRESDDPTTRRQVSQIIFRRWALVRILPEEFHDEKELVRLVTMTLLVSSPEPVDFGGAIGVYRKPSSDHVEFTIALPAKNITSAAIDKRTHNGRDYVRTLAVTFTAPVPCTARSIASALAHSLQVPPPVITTEDGRTRITVQDSTQQPRGTLLLELQDGAVKSILVERADLASPVASARE